MSTEQPPRTLFFDVFGTVVEWRSSVTTALQTAVQQALDDPNKNLSANIREHASAMSSQDWLALTLEWRQSYSKFTKTFDPSKGFMSVDQHHYNALQDLLRQRGIDELFTDSELWDLAFCWHRLDPWSDSTRGLELLNLKFDTATLSNGNVSLLEDLKRYGPLPFTHIVSAEHFGAYKPSPKVYHGAANKFGLEPAQCALVAAHLSDLKAAKSCGFQTIYVERNLEEYLPPDQVEQARVEGYVDMWIGLNTGGFLEVARRFDIESDS